MLQVTDDEQVTETATLTIAILANPISENGGTTTATVTRNSDTTDALIINLSSSDTDEVTVPATVTIPAGQTTSEPFTLTAVDDTDVDGTQTVTITASVSGFVSGTDTLDVTDNDPVTSTGAVLDMDGSGGSAAAQSDGLLVFAALSGVTNAAQLANFISPSATTTTSEVLARVDRIRTSLALDVDGNGVVGAQSDGLLIFAILSGVTEPAQLSAFIAPGAPNTVPQIIAAVEALRSPPVTVAASSSAVSAAVLADDDQHKLFTENHDVSIAALPQTPVAPRQQSPAVERVSLPKSTELSLGFGAASPDTRSDNRLPGLDDETLDDVFHSLLDDEQFLLFG